MLEREPEEEPGDRRESPRSWKVDWHAYLEREWSERGRVTGRGPDEGEPSGYPEEDLAPHEESSEDHREGGRRP